MLKNIQKATKKKIGDVPDVFLLFGEVKNENMADLCQWIMNANFAEDKPEVLDLIINSQGGDLLSAFAAIEVIQGSSIPVRTIAIGQIASSALMLFMSGAKGMRVLTKTAAIMSHTFSTANAGNSHELLSAHKDYVLTQNRMIDFYKRTTGLSEKVISEKLLGSHDAILTPEEAISYKLADIISDLK